MRSYVILYVPVQFDIKDIQREFAIVTGGSTTTQALGAWTDDNGKLVLEKIALIKSFVPDSDLPTLVAAAHSFAYRLLDAGEQSVAIEINGELTFIT